MTNETAPTDVGALTSRTFAAVLFDMDGTLINSIAAVERSWREWARLESVDLADVGNFHGTPSRQIVERLVPADRVEESKQLIDSLELSDTSGVVILPGAEAALAALAGPNTTGRHYAAIVTSCSRPLAELRLEATGLPAPDIVVTASDVAIGKPDPAPFLAAARRCGVDPNDCLVVEDAPAGIRSGKAAGAATLGVLTSSGADELAADGIARDLDAVRFHAGDDGVRMRENAG